MNTSPIEWTDTTWNPVTGCSKVSQGCKNCYAERWFPRTQRRDPCAHPGDLPRAFTDVQCHPERLAQPLRMRKPKRIFVNSMSDLFHEAVPRSFIDAVWSTMAEARHHTFQILTKRPARMLEFMKDRKNKGWKADWSNIWLGVSVEDQATADERIPLLLQTPAAVRFISAEPLLGPIDLFQCDKMALLECVQQGTTIEQRGLDLVIAGYESGPGARPGHPEWAAQLRNQCRETGARFFFKQWGEWAPRPPLTMKSAVEAKAAVYVKLDGTAYDVQDESDQHQFDASDVMMYRAGKKFTGRTLDGREHSELPA